MAKDNIFPALWMLATIATFAWSASDPAHECEPTYRRFECAVDRVFPAFFAGAAWPLYWAWEAAELIREGAANEQAG